MISASAALSEQTVMCPRRGYTDSLEPGIRSWVSRTMLLA